MGELEESGSGEGINVPIKATADEASFQKAQNRIGGLDEALRKLTKIDFKDLQNGIKSIGALIAGIGKVTIDLNLDQVRKFQERMRADLTKEQFTRWGSLELMLGKKPGELTKDIAALQEKLMAIKNTGDLQKDWAIHLGLVGVNLTDFINTEDMQKRIEMLLELAMKSNKSPQQVGALLRESGLPGISDLYRVLKESGYSFQELFGRMTTFTSEETEKKNLAFAVEWGPLKSSLDEMGALLATSMGSILTPFLSDFNDWIAEYQGALKRILTFQDGWLKDLKDLMFPKDKKQSRIEEALGLRGGALDKGFFHGAARPVAFPLLFDNAADVRKAEGEVLYWKNRVKNVGSGGKPNVDFTYKDYLSSIGSNKTFSSIVVMEDRDAYWSWVADNTKAEQAKAEANVKAVIAKNKKEEIVHALATRHYDFDPLKIDPSEGANLIEAAKENADFDAAFQAALNKVINEGSTAEMTRFMDLMNRGVTGAGKNKGVIPEDIVQEVLRLINTMGTLREYMYKDSGQSAVTGNQTNNLNMTFPGVTTEEQSRAVGIGLVKGLSERFNQAFEYSFLMG